MIHSMNRFGQILDLANLPREHLLDIERIAHNLSQINRSAGCFRHPVSVATHSVVVSQLCPPGLALEGLLHDCTESDCGDLKSPIKREDPFYCAIEDKVRRQYEHLWELDFDTPYVGAADKRAWDLEVVTLTGIWPYADRPRVEFSAKEWSISCDLLARELDWRESKRRFLERYRQILDAAI